MKIEIVVGSRMNLMSIADTFWPYVRQWLKEVKILILKFRMVEGLDEEELNERGWRMEV